MLLNCNWYKLNTHEVFLNAFLWQHFVDLKPTKPAKMNKQGLKRDPFLQTPSAE